MDKYVLMINVCIDLVGSNANAFNTICIWTTATTWVSKPQTQRGFRKQPQEGIDGLLYYHTYRIPFLLGTEYI